MKQIILILLSLLITTFIFAQKIIVKEKQEKIGEGVNNTLVVTIYSADINVAVKEWKSKMKFTKAKVSGKKEIFADNASLPSISSNSIDIYAKFSEKGEDLYMVVGFDLGGAYLNSSEHKNGYKSAEKMIYDFAVDISKKSIEKEINTAEKDLKTMDKNLKGLVSDNENLHKDIEQYNQRIVKAEKDIEENIENQKKKTSEIEIQQKLIDTLKKKLAKVD